MRDHRRPLQAVPARHPMIAAHRTFTATLRLFYIFAPIMTSVRRFTGRLVASRRLTWWGLVGIGCTDVAW